MEYYIAEGTSCLDLAKTVAFYIQRGWVPQGGVGVSVGNGWTIYVQAMVRGQ